MQGLGFLAYDFGSDLNKSVTSIFVAPVKGAQKDGANGFVKGECTCGLHHILVFEDVRDCLCFQGSGRVWYSPAPVVRRSVWIWPRT